MPAALVKPLNEAAASLGVELRFVEARSPDGLVVAFTRLRQEGVRGVLVAGDAMFYSQRAHLVDLAARHSLPAVYEDLGFAGTGGLITYGPNQVAIFRRAAVFVDKILKGAKPADLPVEQPTKFELVINLKTAKTLGLTITQSLLQRADQIIELRCIAPTRRQSIVDRPLSVALKATYWQLQRTDRYRWYSCWRNEDAPIFMVHFRDCGHRVRQCGHGAAPHRRAARPGLEFNDRTNVSRSGRGDPSHRLRDFSLRAP